MTPGQKKASSTPAARIAVKGRQISRTVSSAILLVLLFSAVDSLGASTPRLDYRVRVTDMANGEIHVTLAIEGEPGSTQLRAVPSYMDNPVAKASQNPVRNLTVRESDSDRALKIEPRKSRGGERIFAFRSDASRVTVEYDLKVAFKESLQTQRYPIRIPYMNAEKAWLYGNYVFCYPEWTSPKQKAVGQSMSIEVSFEVPEGVSLIGVPARCSLSTIYQLMCLQFALGRFEKIEFRARSVDLSVAFERPEDFSTAEKQSLRQLLETCFSDVTDFFGGAPVGAFTLFVFRDQGIGGMEGAFSCQVYAPKDLDLADETETRVRLFHAVVMHEVFHTWNPNFLFPVEDPWIKEGITGYYGEVLSVRAGILKASDLDSTYSYYYRQLDENPLFRTVPLSDSRIWLNEYQDERWRTLTYDKGKVVTALLDLQIRQETGNQRSLDDVMRALYRAYGGRSYTHAEFVKAAEQVAGIGLDGFFKAYVRGTRLPERREVEQAQKKGKELQIWTTEDREPVPAGAR